MPKRPTHKNEPQGSLPTVVMEEQAAYNLPLPTKPLMHVVKDAVRSPYYFLGMENKNAEGQSTTGKHHFIALIRNGIKKQSLDNLMKTTEISAREMAEIMHTSERTFRRYTGNTLLNAEQSERLVELARLFARGAEVFEDLGAFKTWMNNTVMALGNKKPKDFLDTSLGIEIVLDELGRIEHGIFS